MKKNPVLITSECLRFLKSQTSEVILFYSGGKDSLILLDILTKNGFKVHCCFMYFVKGLEHIDKYLNFARKKYGVEVLELPHFALSQYLNDSFYTFHDNRQVPNLKQSDIENAARKHFNCEWIVSGAKASDSLVRNLMMKNYLLNSIEPKTKHAYPLSAWKKAHVMAYMKQNRLPKTIDYNEGGKKSAGVGITPGVLVYLEKNYPNDLQKILKVFPLAHIMLKEHHEQNSKQVETKQVSEI